MRVLFLIHNTFGTSAYIKVSEMAEALAAIGHDVTLVGTSRTRRFSFECETKDGVRLILAPDLFSGRLRQGVDPWNGLRRVLRVRHMEFDVVHAIDCRPTVLLPMLYFRRVKQLPLVLSWWDWFGRGGTMTERSSRLYQVTGGRVETWLEEAFRFEGHSATVVASSLRDRLINLGYNAKRILIQTPGCFTSRYPAVASDAERRQLRSELSLPHDQVIQVYVGTLYRKDRTLLFAALRKLRECMPLPITIIVGNREPDDEGSSLNVKFTGRLPALNDVLKYIRASDHALLPMRLSVSNMGRWPSKLGDYFCSGVSVVATAVSDLRGAFAETDIGVLADDDSPDAFADAMRTAVSNPSWMHAKGVNARRFAEQKLDWLVIARNLSAWYQQTLVWAQAESSADEKHTRADVPP
jgi:glycosyltransferase involved in cell wall biosynthesis